jgi:hypothetical protein
MEGQEFHGGNSITIRWAVTIHEANLVRPPMHPPRHRFRGTLSLGGFCRWRGAFEMGAMIAGSERSLDLA